MNGRKVGRGFGEEDGEEEEVDICVNQPELRRRVLLSVAGIRGTR